LRRGARVRVRTWRGGELRKTPESGKGFKDISGKKSKKPNYPGSAQKGGGSLGKKKSLPKRATKTQGNDGGKRGLRSPSLSVSRNGTPSARSAERRARCPGGKRVTKSGKEGEREGQPQFDCKGDHENIDQKNHSTSFKGNALLRVKKKKKTGGSHRTECERTKEDSRSRVLSRGSGTGVGGKATKHKVVMRGRLEKKR